MSNAIKDKSEILFLYEGIYNEPNGDPFTGEQRYDDETKNILVSDVRIKRYIRDFIDIYDDSEKIYVKLDNSNVSAEGKETGAAARMKTLFIEFEEQLKCSILNNNENVCDIIKTYYEHTSNKVSNSKSYKDKVKKLKEDTDSSKAKELLNKLVLEEKISSSYVLKTCIDVRLFGGISTETGNTANITGAVQFALLNSSLNKVDLRMHQNTTTFPSKMKTAKGDQQRGSIGTKTLVPYSLNQIHGWINPKSAEQTSLTETDVQKMFGALWYEVNAKNTRTKSNQNAMLLLQIVYNKPYEKIYRVDKLISIRVDDGKDSEQIRGTDDYSFDLTKLQEVIKLDKVKQVNYYTEFTVLENQLKELEKNNKKKLKKMTLYNFFSDKKEE